MSNTEKPYTISFLDAAFLTTFGVGLPILTLGVEALFHLSAAVYVDPIPSWWHIAAIAFVSVANFVVFYQLSRGQVETKWLPYLIGAAIGVSIFYAIVFAPMAPFAVMALMALGIGFLPLSPILSFLAATRLAFILRRMKLNLKEKMPVAPILIGLVGGFGYLLLSEAPNTFTQIGVRQAVSTDPALSRNGIALMRSFGSENALLRSCYDHTASVSDIPSLICSFVTSIAHVQTQPLTIEQARQTFYRVYGRPFNSVPRPTFATGIRNDFLEEDDWGWDYELAGTEVGGRQPGVTLAKSDLKASVDPNLATSYTEWTLKFKNENYANREARMQIELPHGGVVSRATLWVNGEPREAAFAERTLARAAYQAVVATKRDPLLVTSVGPNKVMLQCFPVPAKRDNKPGEMQVRIGITAPCEVPVSGESQLALPRISEQAFKTTCKHHVHVESPYVKDFDLDEGTARRVATLIKAKRDPLVTTTYTTAPLSQGKTFVVGQLQQEKAPRPTHLYVLVDGSSGMGEHVREIADALQTIPADIPTEIRFASDILVSLTDENEKLNRNALLESLRHAPCAGGPDNAALLQRTCADAKRRPGSAVLWIHGPQPILFGEQERADSFTKVAGVRVFDCELFPAPNRIIEKMPRVVQVCDVPRSRSLNEDLKSFISGLCDAGKAPYTVAFHSASAPPTKALAAAAPALSSQMVGLWAYGETLKKIALGDNKGAVLMAAQNRLITPVTGAVVLETDADYKKHGIDKDHPENNSKTAHPEAENANSHPVPMPTFTIGAAPEPEEYALMFVALSALAWQISRRKIACKRV